MDSGQLLHRLVAILASDLYRPFSTPSLYGLLYPGEAYNPQSSPLRVRQVLKRLRRWLVARRLPLKVAEERGSYRLVASAPCTLRLYLGAAPSDRQSLVLERLREAWPDAAFSAADAGRLLGVSARTALRGIESAIEDGALEKVRQWRSTRYRFGSKDKRAA